MSNHHDDFWGDEATWSSRPTSTEPFDDSFHDSFHDTGDDRFDAAPRHAIDTPRVGALGMVRSRWNRLMSSGTNATREHGIVRPVVIPDVIDVVPDVIDVVPDDIVVVPDDIDVTTTFGTPHEPTMVRIGDEPAPLSDDERLPMWNATMFDDIDHDLDLSTSPHDPTDASAHDDVDGSTGLDPKVARLGALAVIATLLMPALFGFGSGSDAGDSVQTATQSPITPGAMAPDVPIGDATVAAASDVVAPAPNSGAQAADETAAPAASPSVAAQPDVAASASIESGATVVAGTSAPLQSKPGGSGVDDAAEVDDALAADRLVRSCAIDYEVVAGDFWIRIADGSGVELSELLDANGASTDTALFPGGSICLPEGSSIPAPPTTSAVTTTAAPAATTVPAATTPTTQATTTTTAPTTTTPATTTPATTLPPNSNASPEQVKQIIRDIWPDDLEDRAIEIAFRESSFAPTAQNFCCSGLFQIYFNVHQSWLSDLGINSVNDLYDPVANTRAAYTLYQRAGGWGPWGF